MGWGKEGGGVEEHKLTLSLTHRTRMKLGQPDYAQGVCALLYESQKCRFER